MGSFLHFEVEKPSKFESIRVNLNSNVDRD